MSLFSTRYKDLSPLETIEKAQRILKEMKIEIEIVNVKNSVDGVYSVNIQDKECKHIFTNGKGLSYEMALASALGEFFERLQNNYLGIKFKKGIDLMRGYKFPKLRRKIETEKINPQVYIFNKDMKEQEDKNLVEMVEFKEIKSGESIFLLSEEINFYLASNGMCAGNSYYEAMVQGISELIERYACREILEGNHKPKYVEFEEIDSNLQKIINDIKSNGFELIFLDCSMNMRLPAIGMIAINKKKGKYLIKFSANPIKNVAIERLLTELLQGKNIKAMSGMQNITDGIENTTINKKHLFENSSGKFDMSTFSKNETISDKSLDNFLNENETDNKFMLEYLIKLLNDQGYNIYIKDTSFTDFNSYKIFIPGLSEVYNMSDWKAYLEIINVRKLMFEAIRNKSIKNYSEIIKNTFNLKGNNIFEVIGVPIESNRMIYDVKIILSLMAEAKGNYQHAINLFRELLDEDKYILEDHYRKIIECKILLLTMGKECNNQILSCFYDTRVIKEAEDLNYQYYIEKTLNYMKCDDCAQCKFKKMCNIDGIIRFYNKIENHLNERRL